MSMDSFLFNFSYQIIILTKQPLAKASVCKKGCVPKQLVVKISYHSKSGTIKSGEGGVSRKLLFRGDILFVLIISFTMIGHKWYHLVESDPRTTCGVLDYI